MKNLFALIVFLLFTVAVVSAQSNIETVYSKSATVTRPNLNEQTPAVPVKIQAKGPETFALRSGETVKPAKEEPVKQLAPSAAAAYSGGFSYESTPMGSYVGIFEIGGLFGIGAKITDNSSFSSTDRIHVSYTQKFFSLQTIQGRQLNNRKVYM